MKTTHPVVALLLLLAGAYLMTGFAYVFTASDWPPFWPPMSMATVVLDKMATNQGSALLATIVFGLVFLALGPLLAVMGIRGLWMSRRR